MDCRFAATWTALGEFHSASSDPAVTRLDTLPQDAGARMTPKQTSEQHLAK